MVLRSRHPSATGVSGLGGVGAWARVASGYSLRLGRSPQASSVRPSARPRPPAPLSASVDGSPARPSVRRPPASLVADSRRPACVRSYTIRPVFGEVQSGTQVGPVLILTFVCFVRGTRVPRVSRCKTLRQQSSPPRSASE